MKTRAVALLRKGMNSLATLAILCTLIGLLIWGHHSHWQLPIQAASEGEQAAKETAGHRDRDKEVIQVAPPGKPSLYRVKFRSAATIRKTGIEVVPVQVRTLAQHVVANGVLDFDLNRYAELSPLAEGTVWKVLKKEGDPVRKGETLALVAAPAVARAKIDYLNALLQVEVRGQKLDRLRAIASSVPEQYIRDARTALREGRFQLLEAQQTLVNYGLLIHSDDLHNLSEEQAARKVAVLGVPESVRKEFKSSELPSNLLPLIAPFDGEVVKRDMVTGEVVTPAQTQLTVADVSRLWLNLDVRLEDVGLVRLGQEVTFAANASDPRSATGTIIWISPAVDKKTRTVSIRAMVENPNRELRPGTFGTGRVLIAVRPRSLTVPARAVQREGTAYVVFVRNGEPTFDQRRIEPGITADGFTEVRSGLRPGEQVVATGSHLLKSAIVHSRFAIGN